MLPTETNLAPPIRHPIALEFTGERYVPEQKGSVELEHMHRYALAKKLASGKRVLDLACGEGYGSSQLSEVAASVTGIDVDSQAIAHAQTRYQKANLQFISASATSLPVGDQSFDLVVSFETIEHLIHQDEMLAEIRRVMAADGILLISSPNKLNYSDANNYSNPFHVKELYREDFEHLLRKYFNFVALAGQRIAYGSLILPDHHAKHAPTPTMHTIAIDEFNSIYDIAIASNTNDVMLTASFLERDVGQSELVVQLVDRVRSLEMELADTYASQSWRITAPLRWGLYYLIRFMSSRRNK